MSVPFLYPKSPHRRRFTPPSYSQYQKYKPVLKQEFYGSCVYCRLPDSIKSEDSFGVDHYRPKKLFPELSTEYLNLYYCCNRCNAHKGRFWPSSRQFKAGQFVPNPCEHVMAEHLRYHGTEVTARSMAGQWSIELLDLNEPKFIEYRQLIVGVVTSVTNDLRASRKTVSEIKKLLKSSKDPVRISELSGELQQAESRVDALQLLLQKVVGENS